MHPLLPKTLSSRTTAACKTVLQAVDNASPLEDFCLHISTSINISDRSRGLQEELEQLGREYAAAALHHNPRMPPIITGLRFYTPEQDIALGKTFHSQYVLIKHGRNGVMHKLAKNVDIHVIINVVSDYLKAWRLPITHHYAPSEEWCDNLGKRPYSEIEAAINRRDLTPEQSKTLDYFRPLQRVKGIKPRYVNVTILEKDDD